MTDPIAVPRRVAEPMGRHGHMEPPTAGRAEHMMASTSTKSSLFFSGASSSSVMPATAWGVTQLIPLDRDIANGIILVGCVPGAMASNVLTSTARGSVAYSVSLTSVATLLSPLTVPLVLWIVASAATDKSLLESSLRLSVLVVLPTVLGFHACRTWNRFQNWAEVWGARIASFTLLWIIVIVVAIVISSRWG